MTHKHSTGAMPAMINYWHVQPSARWGQEDLYGNIGDDDAARVEVAAGAAVLRTGVGHPRGPSGRW